MRRRRSPTARCACTATSRAAAPSGALAAHLDTANPGDYVALMAYVTPDDSNQAALQRLRVAIRDSRRLATTLGFGPRFLHSTGQLHKGGPNTGVYIQITADDGTDVPIPGAAVHVLDPQARAGRGRPAVAALPRPACRPRAHRRRPRCGARQPHRRRRRNHGGALSAAATSKDSPPCRSALSGSAGWAPTWCTGCAATATTRSSPTIRTRRRARASRQFGATTTGSIDELIAALDKPRGVWIMVPSGKVTDDTVAALQSLLEKGDTIIDGGNSNYHDSIARAASSAERGIDFIDAGTSGGIWGLEVGYCLMAGGEKETVDHWRPIFTTLAPPDGFLHVGPPGSGHFVKMVHNGIEYGMLQAYAEGFAIMQAKQDFGELDLHAIAHLWNQGSVVRSWLLELAERAFERDPQLDQLRGWVDDSGEGRWTLEEAMKLSVPAPVLALSLMMRYPVAPARRLRQQGDRRTAQRVRRPPREGGAATRGHRHRTDRGAPAATSDRREPRTPVPFCVVIFGASGDLTKRKLVPALYALAAEGALPAGFTVVGAGRSEMSDEEFRADMRDGVEQYGRVPPARRRVGHVRRGTAVRGPTTSTRGRPRRPQAGARGG